MEPLSEDVLLDYMNFCHLCRALDREPEDVLKALSFMSSSSLLVHQRQAQREHVRKLLGQRKTVLEGTEASKIIVEELFNDD